MSFITYQSYCFMQLRKIKLPKECSSQELPEDYISIDVNSYESYLISTYINDDLHSINKVINLNVFD